MSKHESRWIPEIMYEEETNGTTSNIPFIAVPAGEVMPPVIFIFESRQTGEEEMGTDGNPSPIVEMDLHQYADMIILKESLEPSLYDKVRHVLGLKPLKEAVRDGKKITERVRSNVDRKKV